MIQDKSGRFSKPNTRVSAAIPAEPEVPRVAAYGRVRRWIAPAALLSLLTFIAAGLAAWKIGAIHASEAAAALQPEPMESVAVAVAKEYQHQPTTTAIGTVVALRSVTLRNELPGTVSKVMLTPGEIVEPGTVLVALDVSVEEAELRAQIAQANLAETTVNRLQRAVASRAVSQLEFDRAQAELDVAKAQIERIQAIIARKTIRAPFRARVGLSDVHPGQYLVEGTELTTLQGVDSAAYVDFTLPQHIAERLPEGETVEVVSGVDPNAVPAAVLALDARVDPITRNTTIRARVENAERIPAPGGSVRVRVPAGEPVTAVVIPVSALRKGPGGDHVFVITPDEGGKPRAHLRWVRTGPALGDEVLILSGVSPGEQVAASGSFKLRENALVAIADASPPAGAGITN